LPNQLWLDKDNFYVYLNKYKITHIDATPTMLEQYDFNKVFSLKRIVCGGEPLSKDSYHKIALSKVKIINAYGLTETSVTSFVNIIKDERLGIGTPIANTKCYVLDVNLRPLPIGAVGELYIGGIGLARGYVNQPKLTQESFVDNSYKKNTNIITGASAKLYKTGDLVRWLSDGSLEYLGRKDLQVKIRGYRIELEEIQSVLTAYPGIAQCVVLAKDHTSPNTSSANKYLVSYYVSETKLDEAKIQSYLQSKLPEYMVPQILIHLNELPVKINGKLDVNALPNPEFKYATTYIAPRNEFEDKLCQIWAEVLGLPFSKVGICDDFFKLGGNSILTMKLIALINKFYDAKLKISDIFVYKTIDALIPKLFQTKAYFQPVYRLNSTVGKANLFMIHPGEGGGEVYSSLANKFSANFSCYAVDSYNLHHVDKFVTVHDLAQYYLSHIDNIMLNSGQVTYNLLGWSLGGKIALEIACALEKRGENTINVYLLDTLLNDDYLLNLLHYMDIEVLKKDYGNDAKLRGYEDSYIHKVMQNMNVENELIKQRLSSFLTKTNVCLFKAMLNKQDMDTGMFKQFFEHSSSLKYNNIEKFVIKSNIELIKVNAAHIGSRRINFQKSVGTSSKNYKASRRILNLSSIISHLYGLLPTFLRSKLWIVELGNAIRNSTCFRSKIC
jgi:hypothetical protein